MIFSDFTRVFLSELSSLLPECSYLSLSRNPVPSVPPCTFSLVLPGERAISVKLTDALFRQAEAGRPVRELAAALAASCQARRANLPLPRGDYPAEAFSQRHILFRLSGKDALSEDILCRPFMDSLLFCMLEVKTESFSLGFVPVTEAMARRCGLSEEEIFEAAELNTPKRFPPVICPLQEYLVKSAQKRGNPLEGLPLYPFWLLTNRMHFYGASVLLYPEVREWLSARALSPVLLPLSVHEVLLCEQNTEGGLSRLEDLLRERNTEQTFPEDILSDTLYTLRGETYLPLGPFSG